MVAKTSRSTKKQHLTQLTGMGVGEGELKPALWHLALQISPATLCVLATPALFPIIFGTDSFHLKFARTLQTRRHHRFFSTCVVRQLVTRHFPLSATTAATKPKGIAALGATLGGCHDGELAVDLTDTVPWF